MFNVYFEEDFVLLECVECGEVEAMSHGEFEEMVQEGVFDLVEIDEDCDCCDCEFEDECYEYDEEEFDAHLFDLECELEALLEDMTNARELGDYESYVVMAEAYAILHELLYV